MKKFIPMFSIVAVMSTVALAADPAANSNVSLSSPWGIPKVEISGTGGIAQVRITDGGMTAMEPVAGIEPEPDVRTKRPIYNVAFLAPPYRHAVLDTVEFCLQQINERNETIANGEVCTKPSPNMLLQMPIRPGTTRFLPIIRANGERVAWGWQPERGSHPFKGWRAFGATNSGGTVRNATAAELSGFKG